MKYYDRKGKQIVKNCIIEIDRNGVHQVHESPYKNLYIVNDGKYYYLTKDADTSNIKAISYKND